MLGERIWFNTSQAADYAGRHPVLDAWLLGTQCPHGKGGQS